MSTPRPDNHRRLADARAHRELKAKQMDARVLRLLEAYRPWDTLDSMVLTIIDQTYAALVEILGLDDAPPAGGGPVKISHLVEPSDAAHPPMVVVVEASATHCSVRCIDGAGGPADDPLTKQSSLLQSQHTVSRRASVSVEPGVIHLARAAGGGGANNKWKKAVGDAVRPDVSEKGLLGVLDAMRAHVDKLIRLEDGVIDMARKGGCREHLKTADIIRVRMTLWRMRRHLDPDDVMRRFRMNRRTLQHINRRRRPAEEMDVDQVDEEDVLTKRLKGLHVMENTSSDANATPPAEQGK